MRVYNWNAPDMADNLTTEELVEIDQALCADPKNQLPLKGRGVYIYTPATRRKRAIIAWAISYQVEQRRKEKQAGA